MSQERLGSRDTLEACRDFRWEPPLVAALIPTTKRVRQDGVEHQNETIGNRQRASLPMLQQY